jgi:hypothetical protein
VTNSVFVICLLSIGIAAFPIYRMLTPIPPEDLKAIERFLNNRNETPVTVSKRWFGGVGHWGGRGIYIQTGRPYRVLTQSADGSRRLHHLATDGKDGLGKPQLRQRVDGVWSSVNY